MDATIGADPAYPLVSSNFSEKINKYRSMLGIKKSGQWHLTDIGSSDCERVLIFSQSDVMSVILNEGQGP